jgi:hypothetical protein
MAIKNLSLQTIGLHVGYKDYSKITVGQMRLSPYKETGVFTCSGISIFGKVTDGARGVVTIGKVDSLSKFPFSDSLYVLGTSKFFDDMTVASNVKVTKNLTVSGTTYASVQGTINVQGWKGFDIKHPTKENHRLRYVCLEGPEGGVYHRGILKDSEFIELPDYWKDLVDTKTITVHLTPIGTYQYLYYTVAKNRIIVKNHSNLPTHCSYIVYGERKDGERLIPEYKGNSPEDYPGKNDQYSIAGYHYDRRTS